MRLRFTDSVAVDNSSADPGFDEYCRRHSVAGSPGVQQALREVKAARVARDHAGEIKGASARLVNTSTRSTLDHRRARENDRRAIERLRANIAKQWPSK